MKYLTFWGFLIEGFEIQCVLTRLSVSLDWTHFKHPWPHMACSHQIGQYDSRPPGPVHSGQEWRVCGDCKGGFHRVLPMPLLPSFHGPGPRLRVPQGSWGQIFWLCAQEVKEAEFGEHTAAAALAANNFWSTYCVLVALVSSLCLGSEQGWGRFALCTLALTHGPYCLKVASNVVALALCQTCEGLHKYSPIESS